MRRIRKGPAPKFGVRTSWPASANALKAALKGIPDRQRRTERARNHYDDAVQKPRVRSALAIEQEKLCAFCETRIDAAAQATDALEAIRIAHWVPIAVDPTLAVTWKNLFASCSRKTSCDTHQEARAPEIATAATRDWSTRMRFLRATGKIETDDEALRRAIDEVWNLNDPALCAARAAAIGRASEELERLRDRGARTKQQAKATFLARVRSQTPAPYSSAVLSFVKQR